MTEVVPIIRVRSTHDAAAFYARLGFRLEWEHRFEPGFPVFASIATDDGARIFISEHTGDARPDTLLHLWVDDVDAVYATLLDAGADVSLPGNEPWGREL